MITGIMAFGAVFGAINTMYAAVIGGILGCLFALPLNGIVTGTTNWSSFSEIALRFRITPLLLIAGLSFAVLMGVIGGFFPALRAARLQVVQALR
ncbi:MAG TPA: ABC transporter permease [Gemmatimonadales bacterium]|nr:ABC transporter permease [Gemmatimonadales bacterium]